MTTHDGTYTCSHAGCECRVADDDAHVRDPQGRIYCSEGCRDGEGCQHEGCACAERAGTGGR
jgi:hypothetical protein